MGHAHKRVYVAFSHRLISNILLVHHTFIFGDFEILTVVWLRNALLEPPQCYWVSNYRRLGPLDPLRWREYLYLRNVGIGLGSDAASFPRTDLSYILLHVKGKAVPLQAWSGPEGSRKLRFPDVMTTAQDGGKVVSLTHQPPLIPENTPGTHFC